jgi:DNA-binding NarL/FixJ family response regulator
VWFCTQNSPGLRYSKVFVMYYARDIQKTVEDPKVYNPFGNDAGRYRMSKATIRLAIIGGDVLFQDALAASLALQADFRRVGSFTSLEAALPLIQISRVDVVLLVINNQTGADVVTRALAAGFGGRVIVVAGICDPEVLRRLQRDCAGVFLQSQPISLLHQGIRSIANGLKIMPAIGDVQHERALDVSKLTPRETDVIRCVFRGFTNKEIAAELCISENTVKTFLQQLFRKTGARSRTQLVRLLMQPQWTQESGTPEKPLAAHAAIAAR